MIIVVGEEELLAKTLRWLKAEQIIAYGITSIAQIILYLIGTRIEITIRIRIEQQLIHFLSAAAAAAAQLTGQIAAWRHNRQERARRGRMRRRGR